MRLTDYMALSFISQRSAVFSAFRSFRCCVFLIVGIHAPGISIIRVTSYVCVCVCVCVFSLNIKKKKKRKN